MSLRKNSTGAPIWCPRFEKTKNGILCKRNVVFCFWILLKEQKNLTTLLIIDIWKPTLREKEEEIIEFSKRRR